MLTHDVCFSSINNSSTVNTNEGKPKAYNHEQ